MSNVVIASENRVILTGKVVDNFKVETSTRGKEVLSLTLETEKHVIVGGESKVNKLRHDVRIANQRIVDSFKRHLRAGFYINVLGELAENNGARYIMVTEYGHDATFMYVPPDAGSGAPEAAKGGSGFSNSSKARTRQEPEADPDDIPF